VRANELAADQSFSFQVEEGEIDVLNQRDFRSLDDEKSLREHHPSRVSRGTSVASELDGKVSSVQRKDAKVNSIDEEKSTSLMTGQASHNGDLELQAGVQVEVQTSPYGDHAERTQCASSADASDESGDNLPFESARASRHPFVGESVSQLPLLFI